MQIQKSRRDPSTALGTGAGGTKDTAPISRLALPGGTPKATGAI
jgi:hypothetical protein